MSIMDDKNMAYTDKCAQAYPGYQIKGYAEKRKEIERLEAAQTRWANNARYYERARDKERYEEAGQKVKEIMKEKDILENTILSGTVYVDQSIENRDHDPAEDEFSFAQYCGRIGIDANRARVPMDHYEDTTAAEIVEEGRESTPKMLTAALSLLETDSAERLHLDDILQLGTGVYNDDQKTMDSAMKSVHNRHFANAENKKALEILVNSKTPVALEAENLQSAINTSLCAKAKKNCVIITNKSGFAKLDIDVNGVPLVAKDSEGNMIYKKKYRIIEMPDEILPNSENGSMCVIGDVKNALRFFVVRHTSLFRDDIFPYLTADREIREEIITLRTKSDSAYIVGYIA